MISWNQSHLVSHDPYWEAWCTGLTDHDTQECVVTTGILSQISWVRCAWGTWIVEKVADEMWFNSTSLSETPLVHVLLLWNKKLPRAVCKFFRNKYRSKSHNPFLKNYIHHQFSTCSQVLSTMLFSQTSERIHIGGLYEGGVIASSGSGCCWWIERWDKTKLEPIYCVQ